MHPMYLEFFWPQNSKKKKNPRKPKKRKKKQKKQKQSYKTWPFIVISMEYNFLHLHECIFLAARRRTKEWNVWRNTIPNISPRFIMTLYVHVHVNLKNFIKCMKTTFTSLSLFVHLQFSKNAWEEIKHSNVIIQTKMIAISFK